MTEARSLKSIASLSVVQTLLLTALIALTIPTTILSCFALYYGYKAQEALKEFGKQSEKATLNLEADMKKIKEENEKELKRLEAENAAEAKKWSKK